MAVEGTPLFGWQPRDLDSGERQTAYRIRVVSGGDPARTVRDSGKVVSDRTAYVPYGGPVLTGDAAYRWTVRTWDRAGAASPWSRPAAFGTGIGGAGWHASWIRRTTAAARRCQWTCRSMSRPGSSCRSPAVRPPRATGAVRLEGVHDGAATYTVRSGRSRFIPGTQPDEPTADSGLR
ncbi:hypothetical protein [Actinoplanes auranticolor]|uniref:Fibronectin type-III domain-containing protein n=1 Tax=Actinoplanes auranticolor TaxID=47988 RepID=A0A919S2Z5_9ACTN|nr:hypothetical protein [Actinoplanes auranticolor]GIM62882.1 hypothetical protein Aau02nite_00420 [Actinoplanes auranticolor]